MGQYVDHFLSQIREDFPYVFVEGYYDNPSTLASIQRAPWNGSLGYFRPKALGSLGLNADRVDVMCRAHDAYFRSPVDSPDRARYKRRWQNFLFMFACATLHEMAHFFICYLFRGNFPNTPPGTSYLDYAQPPGGESGRWLESQLFGGAIEYMTDSRQGPDQAGIPFLTKPNRRHYQLRENAVISFVEDPRHYTFPFPTIGNDMTTAEQAQQGLSVLGGTADAPPPMPANARAMQAMAVAAAFPRYNIDIRHLRRRRTQGDAPITMMRAR